MNIHLEPDLRGDFLQGSSFDESNGFTGLKFKNKHYYPFVL
jgi:hypothetical protein